MHMKQQLINSSSQWPTSHQFFKS